jgi:predicted dehydrogenase
MRDGKIVVGQVGYGYWGPNLLRNYMECREAIVKYVCDRSEDQLARVHAKYPAVGLTREYSDLLNDEEIDAILIATPISTHFNLASQALKAGKHVFVEKPLAANSKDAKALVDLAKKVGRKLMVGHTFEYSAPVVKIKELIDKGELGNIYYISSSRINLGLHQSDVSVIWDLAPHDFSMLFYWLGAEPTNVSAFGRACAHPEIADVAFINLAFGSGVVAEVQLSWLAPVKLRRTLIVGDRKMLLYDDTESVEKIKVFDHGVNIEDPDTFGEFQLTYRTGDIVSPRLDIREPLLVEARHFLECIKTGCTPRTDGYNGLRVVKALEKADSSLLSNSCKTDYSLQSSNNGSNGKSNGNGHRKSIRKDVLQVN